MSDETLHPLEFQLFKETFIQLRVEGNIAAGGDGVQTRIDLEEAFSQGWRPPQQFGLWLRSRANLPLAKAVEITTPDGDVFWMPVEVKSVDFRITKEEAEGLAFQRNYRLD